MNELVQYIKSRIAYHNMRIDYWNSGESEFSINTVNYYIIKHTDEMNECILILEHYHSLHPDNSSCGVLKCDS
jgi:hypothetical protein